MDRHMSVFSQQSQSMGLLDSRRHPLLLAHFLPFAKTNYSLAAQQLCVVLLCYSRCVPTNEETTIKNDAVHVFQWTALRFLPTTPSIFPWHLFLSTCPELLVSIVLWKKNSKPYNHEREKTMNNEVVSRFTMGKKYVTCHLRNQGEDTNRSPCV